MTIRKQSSVPAPRGNPRRRLTKTGNGVGLPTKTSKVATAPDTSDVATLSPRDWPAFVPAISAMPSADIELLRSIDRLLFVAGHYDNALLRTEGDDLLAP